MNDLSRPLDWDLDDSAIAGLLDSTPIPDAIRKSAHSRLLAAIAPPALGSSPSLKPLVDRAVSESRQSVGGTENQATRKQPLNLPSQPSSRLPRTANRLSWLTISALAACVVVGLFWWSSSSQISTDQLVAVCDNILTQSTDWEVVDGNTDQTQLEVVSQVLSKYLRVYPSGVMETRAIRRNEISSDGRVWRIPLATDSELYVLVFNSHRDVKNIDSRLNLLAGTSLGWSTAAVRASDRLFVFISKDDLKQSLRFIPLA